ncbi:uncharacterized protein [Vicugna pacos]|uniref:Uncharacterized protein n=1 Tax=Vicugna pacos TaxID=30538 RepID=A0ABM5CY22_VICPA
MNVADPKAFHSDFKTKDPWTTQTRCTIALIQPHTCSIGKMPNWSLVLQMYCVWPWAISVISTARPVWLLYHLYTVRFALLIRPTTSHNALQIHETQRVPSSIAPSLTDRCLCYLKFGSWDLGLRINCGDILSWFLSPVSQTSDVHSCKSQHITFYPMSPVRLIVCVQVKHSFTLVAPSPGVRPCTGFRSLLCLLLLPGVLRPHPVFGSNRHLFRMCPVPRAGRQGPWTRSWRREFRKFLKSTLALRMFLPVSARFNMSHECLLSLVSSTAVSTPVFSIVAEHLSSVCSHLSSISAASFSASFSSCLP